MKYSLLLGALLLFGSEGRAQQENPVPVREVFKNKLHWDLELNHGFVRPTISPVMGPLRAYAINGRVFDLGLGLTFNASEKVGLSVIWKAGAYPFTLGISPTTYSSGIDSKQYFMYASYTPFAEMAATVSYRHFLSRRFVLTSNAGLGFKQLAPTQISAGFSMHGSDSHSSYYLESDSNRKPYVLVQAGLLYKLRNSNLLGLNFSWNYSLKPTLWGSYYIASGSPDFSTGNVSFSGNQLNLGISYVLTGYRKWQQRSTTPY